MEILEVKNRLVALEEQVSAKSWGRAKPWGGAGVSIYKESPPESPAGFYPEPRKIETEFVAELSWLFVRFVEIFENLEGYYFWKFELFGRLGNMANRAKQKIVPLTCQALLLAVLHEGISVIEEMEDGELKVLPITSGNTIYDDLLEDIDGEDYLGIDVTRAYFAKLGIEI